MATPPTEVTVKVNDIKELFAEHQFDPFTDDVETIASITRMAQLPHLVSKLKGITLRVLVPASSLTPATEPQVRRALERYCTHMILETRQWVVIWQPLDTLVQGWWPQWDEERTFRAIGMLPLRVEGYPPLNATSK